MDSIYDHPEYYEVAFSFRDSKHEVDTMEEIARRYSSIPVRHVLEIACGNTPHLPEILRRGYAFTGIDLSEKMLAYAKTKAPDPATPLYLLQANLASFTLPEPVDLAFVLMGSLYVTSTPELRAHFDAMARALKPGALYILDWCIDFVPAVDISDTWEESRDGIQVKATYLSVNASRLEQTYRETVTLEVNDHGARATFSTTALKRAIYPQEFLLFIEARDDFEFVGWWCDWDLTEPVEEARFVHRATTVVRRR